MRIVQLHTSSTAPGSGSPMEPKTSGPIGITALATSSSGDVAATFSVMGEVEGYNPEPITFGGASIISLAGALSAQWSGRVENNAYQSIYLSLQSCSVMSFQSTATEGEV